MIGNEYLKQKYSIFYFSQSIFSDENTKKIIGAGY